MQSNIESRIYTESKIYPDICDNIVRPHKVGLKNMDLGYILGNSFT